jgi:hypothetical protein
MPQRLSFAMATRAGPAKKEARRPQKPATFIRPGERFGDADLIMSSLKRQSAAYAYERTELLELPRTSYYQCAPLALHN